MAIVQSVSGVVGAALVVLSAVLSGAAHAQDFGTWTYAPPSRGWSGLYVGATVGTSWGSASVSNDLGASTGSFDTDGFIGGGTLGYNWQSGQFVLGVETDFSGGNIEGSSAAAVCGAGCSSNVDWLWTLRARAGFDLNGIMPYLTAGLAVGDASFGVDDGTFSASDTLSGYTVGGGLEIRFTGNWSMKAEYLYVDLGKFTVDDPVLAAPTTGDFDSMHIVRGGLNYRF